MLITNLTHFSMCLFHFSTCFEQPSAHNQENQFYQYIIWYILSSDLHTRRPPTRRCIPDDVLIELILLIMSTGLLETCTEVK